MNKKQSAKSSQFSSIPREGYFMCNSQLFVKLFCAFGCLHFKSMCFQCLQNFAPEHAPLYPFPYVCFESATILLLVCFSSLLYWENMTHCFLSVFFMPSMALQTSVICLSVELFDLDKRLTQLLIIQKLHGMFGYTCHPSFFLSLPCI